MSEQTHLTEYCFTFGASETASEWTDRRRLPWIRLVEILTNHKAGRKEGQCIVPATFSGSARKKEDAQQIDVAFLDSDTGVPLAEIAAAVARKGWAAVISSTHSHMSRRSEAKLSNWDRFFTKHPVSTPEDFLLVEKGYRPDVARGATTAETIDGRVQIDHPPCPKFRVVVPLAKPWRASDYPTQAAANAAWKAAVEALAHALSLPHDQSCTDTSRLFYLPRRPSRGAAAETEVLEGAPCDIFSLVAPVQDLLNGHAPSKANGHSPSWDAFEYLDPINGELIDLRDWARERGRTFLIAKMLSEKKPGVLRGYVVENKVHIQCPNDEQHTSSDLDNATFVSNAGHGSTKGFVVHCRHAHCTDKDRLFFVQKMLAERWIEIDDLNDSRFHLEVDIDIPWEASDDPGPQPEDARGEPDLDWEWGKVNATGTATRWAIPLDIFQSSDKAPAVVTDRHIPERLWPFIDDTAARMGVDPTTVAIGTLVTCASVIHDDWKIQPKRHDRTWTESARLWGCIVGDPSSMKSPIIMACTRIVDRMEAETRRQHDQDMEVYERQHAAWKKAKDTEEPEPRRPKLARYLVEGATMEAFQEVLRDDPKAHQKAVAGKVLCRQDEMSEWAGNLDRYGSGKGGGDRGAYLRLYNGGRYTVDRVARGSFAVSNWSACFLTGCQPEPIQKIARDAAEDGLLQRFVYAVPPPAGDGVDREENEAALSEYHGIIRSLVVLRPAQRDNGFGHEHLVFHSLAHVHREEVDQVAKAIALLPDTSTRVKSTLGKWPGLFARLCLTFHMVGHAGHAGFSYVIGEVTAERVKNYMLEVVLPHLIRADSIMFLTPQTGHARWIAGHILAHNIDIITTRDIVHAYRALRSPEQARELSATMASMVSVGWLDPMPSKNPLSPVHQWRVNPAVHERFAEQAVVEAAARDSIKDAIQRTVAKQTPIGFGNEERSYEN